MSQMINNFEKLVDKYKLVNPISPDIQKTILRMRKKLLKNVLRQHGAYSVYFGKVLAVYFAARQLKISISFTLSKMIVIAATIIIASSLTITGIYLYSLFKEKPVNKNTKKEQIADNKNFNHKPILPVIKADYGLNTFTGSKQAERITGLIFTTVRILTGNTSIVYLQNRHRAQVRKIITGTVRELGTTVVVTAKIIDVKTGRLELATEKIVENPADVQKSCHEIAKEIAKKMGY